MVIKIEDYLQPQVVATLRANLSDRSDDELAVQTEECLKFLLIMSGRSRGFIPLTSEVDEVWHELILQTMEYAELCDSLPGRKFIHHQSLAFTDYAAERSEGEIVDEFLSWIPAYVSRFGPFTPERAKYWSFCAYLTDSLGLGLQQLNEIGARAAETAA
ncbi:hypothetical protein GXW83_24060 [Streptacidiphilus sp. PB12-B1b]|uniref:hypothetical protein n=1 Tax=Streptacidiphilus sp. PB12-B1b TaxID=2705012 RepID=UPI0015F93F66|nr:hypothetical protein [Streptacidiphilus sp. PB12-B1b]QMU78324.1 hypothetical protein GXW83_24060 [Streptacidiphilus sp. PB12-B1b]